VKLACAIESRQATRSTINKTTAVAIANSLSTTTGSTFEEVDHTDLVFEPEEEEALFLQLKSKATMQVDGKCSLLTAFANKDPIVLFDKNFLQASQCPRSIYFL
jgi:hypothetical protein